MDRQNEHEGSWIDPRIETLPSKIDGLGLFAKESISKDEVVIIWRGEIMSLADIKKGLARPMSVVEIAEGVFLGGLKDDAKDPDEDMNHSCDPNVWFHDEVTLIARRDIYPGEEIVIDYAMFNGGQLGDLDSVLPFECNCGASLCRHRIISDD